ncbi:hypothetical protein J8273_3921 [Carpediemonas membranifera]|uniref:Uncharacterized protein n=1 Tax=Carpediemonas membranifera TaxID=201153 RepID=A0A8J6AU69_9EUKA|nr:hypothetical protein J8273_3921 [Carpediemonas membranifera]|eukprot:KAG9394288.1 hypothetical protein J8273_3921 [Carpediemonas membranifera]
MERLGEVWDEILVLSLSLPVRMATTAMALFIMFGMFFPTIIFLVWKRRTAVALYKAVSLEILSILGFTSILITQQVYLYSFAAKSDGSLLVDVYLALQFGFTQTTFYVTGYALSLVPIIVRMWRVWCLYRKTLEFSLERSIIPLSIRRVSPFQHKVRASWWMLRRVLVLMIPTIALAPFSVIPVPWVVTTVDMLWTLYDMLVLIALLLMLILLIFTSRRIQVHDLLETRTLILLAIACIGYNIADNIMWWGVLRFHPELLAFHVWSTMTFNTLVFLLLTTPTVFAILRGPRHPGIRRKKNTQYPVEEDDSDDSGTITPTAMRSLTRGVDGRVGPNHLDMSFGVAGDSAICDSGLDQV